MKKPGMKDEDIRDTLRLINTARAEAEAVSRRALYTALIISAQTKFGGNSNLALSGASDKSSVLLRDIALYLLHVCYRLTHEQCAELAGCRRYSASRSIRRIEEARSDSAFNWKLEGLEVLAGGRQEEAA